MCRLLSMVYGYEQKDWPMQYAQSWTIAWANPLVHSYQPPGATVEVQEIWDFCFAQTNSTGGGLLFYIGPKNTTKEIHQRPPHKI